MLTKICKICKLEKPLSEFYKRSNGYYRTECKSCNYQKVKQWRKNNKDKVHDQYIRYYDKNKETILARNKNWSDNNLDKIKQYSKEYYNIHKSDILEHQKKYNQLHKIERAKYWNYYYHKVKLSKFRDKYHNDPKFHISFCISNRIRSSLKNGKNNQHWENIVGYTLQDLMEHLESKFQPGMTWDNYGQWHIDHVIPISYFDYTSYEDESFKICWSLDNLQPLWAKDNLKKSNKFEPEITDEIFNELLRIMI